MKKIYSLAFCLFCLGSSAQPMLKYVVYDMDGLDIGATDLPDGDYRNFDLLYHVVANPAAASAVLGDRVLKLDLNWSVGKGEFGKGITKYIELSAANDRFSFYFLNPLSNYANATADVTISEDDNKNGIFENSLDDKWVRSVTIPRSSSWQLISIPLNTFTDANSGGNGIFDAGYTNDNGKVFTVSLTFHRAAAAVSAEVYFVDMLCFSRGILPTGSSILDLPAPVPSDHCELGCYAYRSPADSVPPEVEALLPPGNKLKYINIFMPYAYSGTTASVIPGAAVQRLITKGYRPVITWEMMYSAYAPLDPVQPSLSDVLSGSFDAYIDAFAGQINTYSDTVIIRLFHEFDGNWYSWCIENNGRDPALFIAAYRYIVDRFNALGVTNVQWMWSPNSSPAPSAAYNWCVDAYPGDAYVDIVATSVYNHPLTGIPPWRSFRSLLAENYFYLRSYFPAKPFYIAESGCRERYPGEPPASETKAEWICQMSDELTSYFSGTKALLFLDVNKEHDWRINSSAAALNALKNCIWTDPYFGDLSAGIDEAVLNKPALFPNPFHTSTSLNFSRSELKEIEEIRIYDAAGKETMRLKPEMTIEFGETFPPGLYLVRIRMTKITESMKLLKQ